MPYIEKKARPFLDEAIDSLVLRIKCDAAGTIGQKDPPWEDFAGPMNYAFTRIALALYPKKKYWHLALVVGVFVTAVLEYYRRWVAPYEDKKVEENGDVYPAG